MHLLRAAVDDWITRNPASKLLVDVSTVDSIQGQERDAVIFSAVRSRPAGSRTDLTFVSEERRLNVAFTRARQALWVVGDFQTLTERTCTC